MKHTYFREGGQVLILIALGAVGLFGIAGLAIDGSAKFSDRRHAQNAADTAALAGALALARGESQWDLDALDRALENGYDNDLIQNTVEVYSPPQSGIYGCSNPNNTVLFNCHDYVQVIIDSYVDTYFARVVGIAQTHNHVEAVASKISQVNNFNFGGNAVVALRPDECALMGIGNIDLTVNGGGLYSNSANPTCSFQGPSCASVIDVNNTNGTQGAITMVGGYNVGSSCQPQADMVAGGAQQIPFPPPYNEIAPPDACAQPLVNITGNPSAVTLSPGHYAAMPPKSNMKDITLQPGVYCIDTNITIGSTDFFRVTMGTFGVSPGVFLYLKPGGSFTFNGGSKVQLWGVTTAQIAADPTLAPYKGFLIYAAPDYASGAPKTCKVNGGSLSAYKGAIYAPYCSLTLSGGSGANGFQTQIIAYEVKFSGNPAIILTYDANDSPSWNIPLQVGLSK